MAPEARVVVAWEADSVEQGGGVVEDLVEAAGLMLCPLPPLRMLLRGEGEVRDAYALH